MPVIIRMEWGSVPTLETITKIVSFYHNNSTQVYTSVLFITIKYNQCTSSIAVF